MLVLFFIVFIGILFAVNVYVYENSEFSKLTGHSLLSVWTNKEVRFLYKLAQKLKKVKGELKILYNIALPQSEWKIDFILLHQSGIYVINAKRSSGWIYGSEQDLQWAQVLENGQMNTFRNPIIENKLKIDDVKKYNPEVSNDLYQSLVVFNKNCSFKKVEIRSQDVDVFKIDELKTFWNDRMDHILTKDQMMSIYSNLETYMIKKPTKEKAPFKDAASS
ncbi:nuclease-related domain-containing protein [Lysinibacillus sp. SGAir0095]|uniref:nuclease-related domain-containing protein n=1 Tax=Lysinibacillus sp. SGAir0095 TaxID=2070463 RepID=UPI001F0D4AE8|nr:nuclease-related domain-containing protein [Lysinibacillus sp. SGAir0095]